MKPFGPEQLLDCYRTGVFPMARSRDDPRIFLIDPDERAIIPLDGFHLSRRLARTVRNSPLTVTADRAFEAVLEGCAAPGEGRDDTWINDGIHELYTGLHAIGRAHSIEVWDGEDLAGGLYGVSLGGAFFGESMFSARRDASKIALTHLVARLRLGGYRLLDIQFMTDHLRQFGAVEIPRADYRARLAHALKTEGAFRPDRLLSAEEAAELASGGRPPGG